MPLADVQAISSNSVASSRADSSTLAVSHPFLGNNIYLTQGFFDSPGDQVQTLMHVPTHLQRINAFPWHPQSESYRKDAFNLDNRHALNNADNYAQYADQ